MVAPATIPGILLVAGNHSSRPSATDVTDGALYSCSTHNLIYRSNGATWATWATLGLGSTGTGLVEDIEFVIDGAGATITTGVKGDIQVDFAGTIVAATLLADQSGSIVVNVWKDTYANFPPVVGDKITASAPPTISSATKSTDSTLTGWTTSFAAGDIFRFNVDSVTTIQRVTICLKVTRA